MVRWEKMINKIICKKCGSRYQELLNVIVNGETYPGGHCKKCDDFLKRLEKLKGDLSG